MKKTILKNDLKTSTLHFNEGGMVYETKHKIDGILNNNKAQANDYQPGKLIGDTQRHKQKVADIPTALYFELVQKFGQPKDNPKAWRKWLNDPDNRFFRTGGGNV